LSESLAYNNPQTSPEVQSTRGLAALDNTELAKRDWEIAVLREELAIRNREILQLKEKADDRQSDISANSNFICFRFLKEIASDLTESFDSKQAAFASDEVYVARIEKSQIELQATMEEIETAERTVLAGASNEEITVTIRDSENSMRALMQEAMNEERLALARVEKASIRFLKKIASDLTESFADKQAAFASDEVYVSHIEKSQIELQATMEEIETAERNVIAGVSNEGVTIHDSKNSMRALMKREAVAERMALSRVEAMECKLTELQEALDAALRNLIQADVREVSPNPHFRHDC